jgi:hypothetical protein
VTARGEHAVSGDGLTPIQRRAARLLAAGLSKPVVAGRLGTTARTLRRWAEDPAFRALLAEPADPTVDVSAFETLRELLHSPNEKVRLAAATELIRYEAARNFGVLRPRR